MLTCQPVISNELSDCVVSLNLFQGLIEIVLLIKQILKRVQNDRTGTQLSLIIAEDVLDAVDCDFNRYIRAGDSAHLALNTPRLIYNFSREIALEVDDFRHFEYFLGADPDAQFASLAAVSVYDNLRHNKI